MIQDKPHDGFAVWKVIDAAGRVILSCLVIWLVAVCLTVFWGSSFHSKLSAPDKVVKTAGRSERATAVSRSATSLWPHFPSSSPVRMHELEINGITYNTESWETCSPPSAVLDYYRGQMAARGWTDVTEESYNLRPEVHRDRSGDGGVQTQAFLDLYRKVMGSSLALKRGSWSLHVGTEDIPGKAGWSRVTICAAATPSIKEFADPWVVTHESAGRTQPRELDVVERSGDQRFRTRISHQDQAPERAFEGVVETLQKNHWRPMMTLPAPGDQSGRAALLVRGEEYGALAVTRAPDGNGSSVAWTEVSPEK